jgi:DNA-binding MarR family transcriptional regulator
MSATDTAPADGEIQAATHIQILQGTVRALVRSDRPDLTLRQVGTFLTVYLENEMQTVGGLAEKLGISRPAITRSLDRLTEFDLIRRKDDPNDRRSVLVARTTTGKAFLRELQAIQRKAARAAA